MMRLPSAQFSHWWGRWGGLVLTLLAIAVKEGAAQFGWRISFAFLPLAIAYAGLTGGWRCALPAAGLVVAYANWEQHFGAMRRVADVQLAELQVTRLLAFVGVAVVASLYKQRTDRRIKAGEAEAARLAGEVERERGTKALGQATERAEDLARTNEQLQREIADRRRAEQVSHALIDLGAELNRTTRVMDAARAVLKVSDSIWHWDAALLDLYSAETGLMQELLNFDVVQGERREFPMARHPRPPTPVLRRVIEHGPELLLREPPFQLEPGAELFGDTSRPSASIMRVPLRRDGRPVGVISIHSYTPQAYTADDLRILGALADFCGGAFERIHTAESLRQSEERLSYALRGASDGLWDWNLETNEVFFSPRWKEMLGYADDELPNRFEEWEQRVHPEELPKALQAVKAVREGRTKLYEAEFRMRHKEGHWVDILSRGTIVRDAQGQPVRMVGTHVDITARRGAERALAESEQSFRLITEDAPVTIFFNDAAGRTVFVNEHWSTLSGMSREESLGTGWTKALHPEDRERYLAQWQRSCEAGSLFSAETRLLHVDGSVRWMSARARRVLDEAGRLKGYIGTAADITSIKEAELALRASEEKFRLLTQSAPAAIFLDDEAGNCVFVSERWTEMSGMTVAESLGKGWLRSLHSEDREAYCRHRVEAGAGEKPFEGECRFYGPDGRLRWMFVRAIPICGEAGRVNGRLGVVSDITAIKQAELAVQESERRFRTLAESSPVGIFQTDEGGNCLYVNPRWRELTGLSAEAAAGRGWEDALHPDDRERVAREWYEAAIRGGEFSSEYRYLTPDGSVRWILGNSVPLRDAAGRVSGHLGTVADITARKAAEQALRTSEARFRTLAEFAPVGIFQTDALGNCVYVNTHWRQLTGRPAGQALGSGWLNAVHPDDRTRVLAERDAAWAAGLEFDGHYRYLRPDGTIRWVHTHSVALRDANGVLTGHMGTITDVTERRQFERALREREARLSMIFQSVSDPLFLAGVEPDGGLRILSANRAFFEVMGFQEHDVIGRRVEKFLPSAAAEAFSARAREGITSGRSVQYEETLHLPTGRLTGLFTVTPVADSAGSFNQLLGVMHNLTDSRRLERQLLEIGDRERARIGQDLHDDLCQQLWGTELAAKILRDQLAARGAAGEVAQAEKIACLLNSAIGRAKDIARGLAPHDLRRDNLVAALEGFAAVAADLFKVPVEVSCPAHFAVRDDATAFHLFRIVQEAVTNAGKHAQARHVFVGAVESDGCVTLAVRDDGRGMPPSRPANGGLGSEIMTYRARLIGATLSVVDAPGGGTEVRCVFAR